MRKTKKNSKRTKAEENPREKATSQKKERRGRKNKTYEVFLFYFIFLFSITKYLLTILTYLQTIYGTYATNKTILYLQNNTYLQCEILTLLTILYSTYNTKLAILTYNEILTLLTVLYSTLYIYTKKTAACTTYITDYIRYKNQKIKGRGSMVNFS